MNHYEQQRRIEKLDRWAKDCDLWQNGNTEWAPQDSIVLVEVRGKLYGPIPAFLLDWSIVDRFAIIEKEAT